MVLTGPNVASLLLAFNDVAQKENYSLPPFAGTWATATVNNPVRVAPCDQPRTPLIGAGTIKDLMKKIDAAGQRNLKFTFGYCRRGTGKQATVQSLGAAARIVDNQIFSTPPFAACDERVDDEVVQNWHNQCRQLYDRDQNTTISSVVCIHNEKRERPAPFCSDCEADAIERLEAISKGSVVLSLDQELSQRGQAAIFFDKNGVLKTETWKTYAGGEAECVLAVLSASGLSPYVAPLFIAQDPNFLWPLIADHGSIRAALEFVAPHIDWDERVGSVKENLQEQISVIPSCKPGKYFRRCGNSFCCNMERIKDKIFEVCTRCDRRQYCSKQCQLADWPVHKLECGPKTKEEEANPRLDDLAIGLVGQEPKELKHQIKIAEGDDCIVHGLQAKPHYNGMVGIIGHTTDSGRVSVTLKYDTAETVLSVKPTNLYCIGVFCRKRKKKSRVFKCAHGLDICEECYFDFSTVNRLAELKYKGQDMTSASAIDQVNTMYFPSLSAFDIEVERSGTFDREWPIECNGMQRHPKQRFILKALLQVKQPMSLHAEAAKTAFITYGGAFTDPTLRADTKLGDVANML